VTEEKTTFARWPQQLRLSRGLFNGYRVQLAREFRGLQRYALARKLEMSAKELARRESAWCFWTEHEQMLLAGLTSFPVAFFVQDDPPAMLNAFVCGHTQDDEPWCEYHEELR
jgi:hypothetical protein